MKTPELTELTPFEMEAITGGAGGPLEAILPPADPGKEFLGLVLKTLFMDGVPGQR